MNEQISAALDEARTVAITAHIRPDGDAVGSCLGLRRYIELCWPQTEVRVYLEPFADTFDFLPGASEVIHDFTEPWQADLAFVLDCSDPDRCGGAIQYMETAGRVIWIDHHATGNGQGDIVITDPSVSSASELLCTLIDIDRLDQPGAESLYFGIVHDSGVFKYNTTTEQTMRIAGRLITLGARPWYVIDETFYKKTFAQNKALGRALDRAALRLGGAFISTYIDLSDLEELGLTTKDLDGIVDQLRITDGVLAAAFLYETEPGVYKASLRSNNPVDVSRVAAIYGGGGHVQASGCSMTGDHEKIADELAAHIGEQL